VSDPRFTTHLLQDIVRRESRSLLQYVSDSFPWTTLEERQPLETLQALVAEEREGTAALARYLARKRLATPYLGSYPMAFTSINFISFEHLLPMLADDTRKSLERLEKDLGKITDPEARCLVQNVVAMKKRHLQALEALATTCPETYSTVH
jgi:rubrerythrin